MFWNKDKDRIEALEKENQSLRDKINNDCKCEKEELERLYKLIDNYGEYCSELEDENSKLRFVEFKYNRLVEGKDLELSRVGCSIAQLNQTIAFLTDFKKQLIENKGLGDVE